MENEIGQSLQQITSKIRKLKIRNQRLEAENETLRRSVFEYLQQLEEQKKEAAKINQSITQSQIGQTINVDRKNMLRELDKYILMIDKCIAAVKADI